MKQGCYPPQIALGGVGPSVGVLRVSSVLVWLIYIVIVLGAATRVWDAGVSCPDWPHCYGVWWPWPESRVSALNGVGYVVNGYHYEAYQVFLEWFHRLCAAAVGVLMLALVPTAVRLRPVRWPLGTAFALLALQVKLGALTVWLGNIHWTVAIHLGNAMLLLACVLWLRRMLAAWGHGALPTDDKPMWVITFLFAGLVWVTMMVGAFVSSAHAGGLCGGLFDCAGTWLPDDLGQRMHMAHRALALLVVAWSIALIIVTKRRAPALKKSAVKAHVMVWGQAALGIATLYSFANYADHYRMLSLLHLAWGTVVFMVAVGLVLRLRFGEAGRWHG